MDQNKKGIRYTKQRLKQFILDVYNKIGHPPTTTQYQMYYSNIRAIDRRFNGFNNAIVQLFGQQFRYKVNNSVECKCEQCGTISIKTYSQSLKTKSGKQFCSKSCSSSYNGRLRVRVKKFCVCRNCGKSFIKKRQNITCSRECLKEMISKRQTDDTRNLFKNITKQQRSDWGKKGGKASAQVRVKRSKDQISLFQMCFNEYKNVTSNQIITDGWDADILINDHKIAVLWNGPWHYKQLNMKNHSLKQVQKRDEIKTAKFQQLGWKVLIFRDDQFTPQSAFEFINKIICCL